METDGTPPRARSVQSCTLSGHIDVLCQVSLRGTQVSGLPMATGAHGRAPYGAVASLTPLSFHLLAF